MKRMYLLIVLCVLLLAAVACGGAQEEAVQEIETDSSEEVANEEMASENESVDSTSEESVDNETTTEEKNLEDVYIEMARQLITRLNQVYASDYDEIRRIYEEVYYDALDHAESLIESGFFSPGKYENTVSTFENESLIISEDSDDAFTYSATVELSATVVDTGELETVRESFVIYVEKIEEDVYQIISATSHFVD